MTPPAAGGAAADASSREAPTAAEAAAFVDEVERELRRLWVNRERAGWVQANFITEDTQALAADAARETMVYLARAIPRAQRFDGLELGAELRRKLERLRLAGTLPAPREPALAAELATLMARMEAAYGIGKLCPARDGALGRELRRRATTPAAQRSLDCRPGEGGVGVGELGSLMAESRNEAALREAWLGWRTVAPPMRADYARYVEIGNAGARDIGFADVGELWQSRYDMPPAALRSDVERLWGQVKPLYDDLHCYVRAKLRARYGVELVGEQAPIPAHLLGNMWAQQWNNVYDLVEPFPGRPAVDVTPQLVAQRYDERRMVRTAEGFFTSLGLDPLPPTFWERSLFTKPADREVECHASAWDVTFDDDLRIKMCIQITDEDLGVIHHELGHDYYFHYYHRLPILFQEAANDGFHEAIGDTVALSITPGYLRQLGLVRQVANDDEATVNYLMKMALDKVAFLPFGKVIDQWRWDVFAGRIPPDRYNAGWWELRRRYQGIAPPTVRTERDFDPGAKYHVPASVPYLRYFLSFVYQFQLHRALCRAAGHEGPLYRCSIYGSQAAGARLRALLELGASRPWQEALYALSGERQADAGALLEYFAPLRRWLREQTKDEVCGW